MYFFNPNFNRILIFIILIFEGVIFFIRCYNQEPKGDELLYQYVWEQDDETNLWDKNHKFKKRISTIEDVLKSQKKHYKYANGRVLVHAGEQAFTDHKIAFSLFNTIIFELFVILIIFYCSNTKSFSFFNTSFLQWFIVFIIFIFCLPEPQIFISINLAPNYLWPATLAIGILCSIKFLNNNSPSSFSLFFFIVLGLLFGLSHEGFVIPIGGALFLFIIVNVVKNKKLNPRILLLAISIWLAALIMIFAPGNINRFLSTQVEASGSALNNILQGFNLLSNNLFFWVILILTIILYYNYKKHNINDQILLNTIFISIVFSLFIHTGVHSFTPLFVFIILLLLKYLFKTKIFKKPWFVYLFIPLFPIFLIQQAFVAKDSVINYNYQKKIINEYKHSSDGIICYTEPDFSFLSSFWIKKWDLNKLKEFNDYNDWNKVYSNGEKQALFLNSEDYQAAMGDLSFFIDANKVRGNAPVYKSKNGIWLWVDPRINLNNVILEAKLRPVSIHDNVPILLKIKFLLMPDSYSSTLELKIDTIQTRKGNAYKISIPGVRAIEEINLTRK